MPEQLTVIKQFRITASLDKALDRRAAELGLRPVSLYRCLLANVGDDLYTEELRRALDDQMAAVLRPIIEQLRLCGYECEGGPLEHNMAFVKLCRIAGVEDDD